MSITSMRTAFKLFRGIPIAGKLICMGNCAVLKHHETVEIAPAKELFKFLDSSPPNHQKYISEKI